ncbi:chitin synthase chs-1-like [Branchiostoma floridae]|uniref:chitin synthase n=1 Tax=Branchiostoma floridae TaxID=7739 RepID=A0A9J7KDV4_BRAFL|nr:chitin synthase chs-1-like [Branchiostoma floridae]
MAIVVAKVLSYVLFFHAVLGSAIGSKMALIILASNTMHHGNDTAVHDGNSTALLCKNLTCLNVTILTTTASPNVEETTNDSGKAERAKYMLMLMGTILVPEVMTVLRNIIRITFSKMKGPSLGVLWKVCLIEALSTSGICLFVLRVLPRSNFIFSLLLMNGVCFVPAILKIHTTIVRKDMKSGRREIMLFLDVISWLMQTSALCLFPAQPFGYNGPTWEITLSLFLISFRWWETFAGADIVFPFFFEVPLYKLKVGLSEVRCKTYIYAGITNVLIIALFTFLILAASEDIKLYNIFEPVKLEWKEENYFVQISLLFFVQLVTSATCFLFSRLACMTCVHRVGFALPLCLATPATIVMFVIDCQWGNVFRFNSLNIWECDVDLKQSWREITIGIVLWWLSQLWISSHIWFRSSHRFAPTSKLFVRPMYCGGLVEQCLMLNRKSKDENEARTGSNVTKIVTDVVAAPVNSLIYLCATMWHETEEEMVQILKSICRMDLDQASQTSVPDTQRDNYRCETHILFDDAMDLRDDGKLVVNDFVRQLCKLVPTAANAVRDRDDQVHVLDPTLTPTPYGGRLVWRLPGGHKMVAHLKDKMRIRHRKRWSQVMYMYHLLGWSLKHQWTSRIKAERDPLIKLRLETLYKLRCDNTYILALDGDVDFQPSAVQLLVDLMRRNPQVGAACGRIHPIGSGPLIWYQMFEYAIGHWFQKTAEHVLGCVLCSPGCFSLFRATAIMDDNVMHKYTTKPTEAKHFVQYDQGEDRWLCTLMLQQGWRVEYSAASDAFTYAPEGFKEFFNQRRRWGPSTMANVMDLLLDGRRTAKVNSSISNLYIIYQMAMMISSVLGPATVCMMIAGALTYAFKWDNVTAMAVSVAPPIGFIILCFIVKPDTQINVAAIMSAMYACVMMAVVVGIAGQITVEGPLSPVAIFTFLMCGLFLTAAIIHPQEFWNIACGALYLLCVPSGYLLLIIYSLCNMNIVSWGTREVKKKGGTKKAASGPQPKTAKERFMQLFKGGGEDDESGYLCGCGNLFKCEMCPRAKRQDDYLPLVEALDKVYSRAASRTVSRLSVSRAAIRRSARRVSFSGDHDLSSDLEEELMMDDIFQEELLKEEERPLADEEPEIDQDYWLMEDVFASCPVQNLDEGETKFWKSLIAKYLHPLEEDKQDQERIAGELKSLRNKVTFGFFMLNALWMIVTFVLQINTKDLYIPYQLPDGTNLKVEALGLAFLVFFIVVLVIQFVSMVFHRFSTLIHILAATELSCRKKKVPTRRVKRTSIPTINVDDAATELADDISQQPIVTKITVSPAPARRGSHQTPNRIPVSSGRRLSREQAVSSGRRLSRDQAISSGRRLSREQVVSLGRRLSREQAVPVGRSFSRDQAFSSGRRLSRDQTVSSGRRHSREQAISSGRRLSQEQVVSSGRRLSREQVSRNRAQQPTGHNYSNRRKSRRESMFEQNGRNKRRSSSLDNPSWRGGIQDPSQSLLSVRPGEYSEHIIHEEVQRSADRKQRMETNKDYTVHSLNYNRPPMVVVDQVDIISDHDDYSRPRASKPRDKPTTSAHISHPSENTSPQTNEPRSTDMEKTILPIRRTEWNDNLHREMPTTIMRTENTHDSRSTITCTSPLPEYIEEADLIIKDGDMSPVRSNPDNADVKGQGGDMIEYEAERSGTDSDVEAWDWTVSRRDNQQQVLPAPDGSDVKTASQMKTVVTRDRNPLKLIKRKVLERRSRRFRRTVKI